MRNRIRYLFHLKFYFWEMSSLFLQTFNNYWTRLSKISQKPSSTIIVLSFDHFYCLLCILAGFFFGLVDMSRSLSGRQL